jgi:hypothetical protein
MDRDLGETSDHIEVVADDLTRSRRLASTRSAQALGDQVLD